VKIRGELLRNPFVPAVLRPLKNAQFWSSSRKAIILTTGIHWVFRGLKFEPDAGIGQKGTFFKGLTDYMVQTRIISFNKMRLNEQ